MLTGIILLLIPLYAPPPLLIVDTAEDILNWDPTLGSVYLDSSLRYEGASSIAWSTNVSTTSGRWNSYLLYRIFTDWRQTPIFNVQIFPHYVPPSPAYFEFELMTTEGVEEWTEYQYSPIQLTAGGWNNISVNLHTPNSGTPDLALVRAFRFHWELEGYTGNDFITNIDLVQVFPLTGQSIQFTLTVLPTTNGDLSFNVGSYIYDIGSEVTVTASPSQGYKLEHFELDGVNVGSQNPYTITMNQDHTLGAIFTVVPLNQFTVTIVHAGNGVGTTSPDAGTYTYVEGTTQTFNAVPNQNSEFAGWNYNNSTSTDTELQLTINQDYTVTATFVSLAPPDEPHAPYSSFSLLAQASGGIFLIAGLYLQFKRKKT